MLRSPADHSASSERLPDFPGANDEEQQIPAPPPAAPAAQTNTFSVAIFAEPPVLDRNTRRFLPTSMKSVPDDTKFLRQEHFRAFHGPVAEHQSGSALLAEQLTRELRSAQETTATVLKRGWDTTENRTGRQQPEAIPAKVILDHPGTGPKQLQITRQCLETLSQKVKRLGELPTSPVAPYHTNVSWGYSEAMLKH
jgi:hypothetical protein